MPASISESGLESPGRALRSGIAWWLTLALVLALAHLVHSPASALADEPCFLDEAGNLICFEPETSVPTGPPSLINAAAYRDMTSDQAAAMHRLEEQAVQAVLTFHGLPGSDAPEVRFWAWDEAAGLLQKLVVRAINTLPTERTPDQQQAVTWIGDLATTRALSGVLQTGAEYAAWAGLSLSRYWELVNGGASKDELTAFLSRKPQPYNGSTPSTSTGGFCKYVPPAPYTDEYEGRTWQTCFTPCTLVLGNCEPPVSQEQFVRWGQARAASGTDAFNEAVIATSGITTAAASYLGTNLAGGLVEAWITESEGFTDVAKALMPEKGEWNPKLWEGRQSEFANTLRQELNDTFFSKPNKFNIRNLRPVMRSMEKGLTTPLVPIPGGSTSDAALRIKRTYDGLAKAYSSLKSEFPRLVNKLVRAGLGFSAEIIVFTLTTAIEEAIRVAEVEMLPRKIASTVSYGRSMRLDAVVMSVYPGFTTLLRNLLANALVPDECGERCPVTFPVRKAAPIDPQFMVQAPGAATWTQTSSLRFGNVVDDTWAASSVRVSDRWVVEKWMDPDYGPEFQSLTLHYTNWEMQPETAWLRQGADGAYSFTVVSPEKTADFDLSTCREDHTCWTTNAIHYLNPDGNPRTAFLESYEPPTGAPTASALAPLLGHAVTFNAGDFAPGDPRGMLTYRWRFQKEGCVGSCTIVEGGRTVPDYTAAFAGPVVTHTWQTPGSYQVELTATDAFGHTAVKTLTVNVGSG